MNYSIKIFYPFHDVDKNSIKFQIFKTMINNFTSENENVKLIAINDLINIKKYVISDYNLTNKFNTYLIYQNNKDFDLNLQFILKEMISSDSDVIIHHHKNDFGFTLKSSKNHIIKEKSIFDIFQEIKKFDHEVIINEHDYISLNSIANLCVKTLSEVKNKSHINFLNIVFNFRCSSIMNIHEYYSSDTLLEICESILKLNIPKIKLYQFDNETEKNNIMLNSFYIQKINIIDNEHKFIKDIFKHNIEMIDYLSIFISNYKINNNQLSILLNYLFDKINQDNNIDVLIFDDKDEEIVEIINENTQTNESQNILLSDKLSIVNSDCNYSHNIEQKYSESINISSKSSSDIEVLRQFSNKYLEISNGSNLTIVSNILNDKFDYQYLDYNFEGLKNIEYSISIFRKIKNKENIRVLFLQKL